MENNNKNKLIALVTGGNGALGIEITKQLLEKGHIVILVLSHLFKKNSRLRERGLNF